MTIGKATLLISRDADVMVQDANQTTEDEFNRVITEINSQTVFADSPHVHSTTALTSGGDTSTRILISSNTNFGIYAGSAAPTISAAQGSLYLRSDGSGTSNRVYINTDGGTSWTAIQTAS